MSHKVRNFVLPCQSGYVRDCGDAHLLVHELTASARDQSRPLWCVTADIWKAFPRTWRADFLDLLMRGPGIGHGCAALVDSILEWDEILVTRGGCSCVKTYEGVPEGGKLGPFGFTLLPDSLARTLLEGGFGVGRSVEGRGVPRQCTHPTTHTRAAGEATAAECRSPG